MPGSGGGVRTGSTVCSWFLLALLCGRASDLQAGPVPSSPTSNHESKLVAKLASEYRARGTGGRPVLDASRPVDVAFSVWLIQILDFDIKQQVLSALVWKEYQWKDEFLVWDPAEFGGLGRTFLYPHQIWIPDIELYNTIDGKKVEMHENRALVWSNGTVVWVPTVVYRSTCPIDVTDFPFDTQVCKMKFGSWVYGDSSLRLSLLGPQGFRLDTYSPHVEWDLMETDAVWEQFQFYGDTYSTVTFSMTLKRNSGLWVRLMLLPMILLSAIACIVFWIPPHRPDRTTISMSLFASFFLLLLLIVQSAPPTTATRLVTCCTLNIVMVALGMLLSVLNVNLYLGRGQCRGHLKDTVKCFCNRLCIAKTTRLPMVRSIPSQVTVTKGDKSVAKGDQEAELRLTRRQRLALTLDSVFFVAFLANLAVVCYIMFSFRS